MAAFMYVKRKGKKASARKGSSYIAKGKKPPLGSGERFRALSKALNRNGIRNPAAVAAYVGRKKYGAKKFAMMSAEGRRRH